MKIKFLLASLFLFITQLSIAQVWNALPNCPGNGRRQGISFEINNKIYVGLGWSGSTSNRFNDLWEFDIPTSTWTQRANFPGVARYGAVSFVINGKAYVGTGGLGNAQFVGDFYEYNPTTNVWIQKASFPGGARDNAFGFSLGQKGYLGCGYSPNGGLKNDFWEYTPITDSWVQKGAYPGSPRIVANGFGGFSGGNIGYAGWGYGAATYYDFFKYNPANDTWSNLSVPSTTLQPSFIFPLNNSVYACLINGTVNQIYKYDIGTNQWALQDTFPGDARYSNMTANANGKGYLYGGALNSNLNNTISDIWSFEEAPLCTLTSNFFSTDTIAACGNSIILNAQNNGANYLWSNNATTQSITANSTGWYKCTITQGVNCSATDSVYVLLPHALPISL